VVNSVFAVRPASAPTLEAAMDGYIAEIVRLHPDWKPYSGKGVRLTPPQDKPWPRFLTSHVVYQDGGRTVMSRLSVSIVNGWVIEVRSTGAIEDATSVDFHGALAMLLAQMGALGEL
jgi:hypothetical protein